MSSDEPLVQSAIKDLQDGDSEIRTTAARTLGKLGAAEAVEPLQSCLKDESWMVRMYAAEALGRIGSHARDAVPALIQALDDKHSNVVAQAKVALKNIATPEALASLES